MAEENKIEFEIISTRKYSNTHLDVFAKPIKGNNIVWKSKKPNPSAYIQFMSNNKKNFDLFKIGKKIYLSFE